MALKMAAARWSAVYAVLCSSLSSTAVAAEWRFSSSKVVVECQSSSLLTEATSNVGEAPLPSPLDRQSSSSITTRIGLRHSYSSLSFSTAAPKDQGCSSFKTKTEDKRHVFLLPLSCAGGSVLILLTTTHIIQASTAPDNNVPNTTHHTRL